MRPAADGKPGFCISGIAMALDLPKPDVSRRATLNTLKKRREFLRVKGGPKWSGAAFMIDSRPALTKGPARFGFTVTKKLSPSAVTRNRMRRRLKEAVRLTAAEHAAADHDYVVVARSGALERQFEDLCSDFKTAFQRLARAKPKP